MKNFKLLALSAIVAGFVVSCQQEEITGISDESNIQVSDAVLSKMSSLGVNKNDVTPYENTTLDGDKVSGFISGDIFVSKEGLASADAYNPTDRQYRTNNLVTNNRTYRVYGYTGNNANGLTSTAQTALRWSVNNFNRLNTGLNFTVDFGTNYQPNDIVVYRSVEFDRDGNPKVGGVAGFPKNGRPHKFIKIFQGMDGLDTNTNEHVITHEIGHSLGLRHTDWFSRQSCGQSGEGAGPDGAIQIPGTPSGYDSGSLMLACFGNGEDGEFGQYDVVALEYLY